MPCLLFILLFSIAATIPYVSVEFQKERRVYLYRLVFLQFLCVLGTTRVQSRIKENAFFTWRRDD
jgi:hypothetical protein